MTRRLAEPIRHAMPRRGVPIVIALGANLGDRSQSLDAAVHEIAELPLTSDVACSDPVSTVAMTLDGPDPTKPGYLNAVATARTRLAPSLLLAGLHAIEQRHGRVRVERWGDRTLDLDLVAYGLLTSEDPRLTLPHPRAHERDFVLAPWLAVDPDAQLPGHGAVADLVAALAEAT